MIEDALKKSELDGGFRVCTSCKKNLPLRFFIGKGKAIVVNTCSCCRERAIKWEQNNKEKVRERRKKYREENRERVTEVIKRCREKNREKIMEYNKKWRQNNPVKVAKYILNEEQKKGNYIDKESYDIKLTALVAGKVFRASEKGRDISKMNLNEWRT